ncbi:MAG: hypothetical protein VKO39_00090 [Cyanobacteriota bacterium]|nr:hypothetical protein [Cyanobacteriota bacterium]
MFFFRKQKFFLDLTETQAEGKDAKAGQGTTAKVILAPPVAAPAAATPATAAAAAAAVASAPPAAVVAPTEAGPAEVATAPARTTAEEIAAQLAAEAASRPAPTFSTFAPDCLAPGAATPRRRRKAGANLGAFKEIAKGMMKS